MRSRTLAIILIVFVALLPTWYAAAQPVEHAEEVGIDVEETDIRPLQSIIDTPEAFTPAQVGVVIWLALGALVAAIVAFHRFIDYAVSASSEPQNVATGGVQDGIQTDHRWIVEYVDSPESVRGLLVILLLMVLVVVLSTLLIVEFRTLGRTQYFGLYVGAIFLALAGMAASYYAWFLPHVQVAEERYHD